MEYDLAGGLFPEPRVPNDYVPSRWSQRLLEEHSETKFNSFRFEIDANVFPCLGNLDGCRRLMGDISGRPSFLPNSTILVAHHDHQTGDVDYCGTIQAIRDPQNRGSIQNIGVTPGHRGYRIGTWLIHHAFRGFITEGIQLATLEVTAQNTKALRLYERLGFQITRTVFKAVEVAFA